MTKPPCNCVSPAPANVELIHMVEMGFGVRTKVPEGIDPRKIVWEHPAVEITLNQRSIDNGRIVLPMYDEVATRAATDAQRAEVEKRISDIEAIWASEETEDA